MTAAGICLGIGLAAAFDGIVLHQLLGWHHMISGYTPFDTLEGLAVNTLWDGAFNAAAVIVSIIGFALFWRASRWGEALPTRRRWAGLLLSGFGGFNLVEGILDHHLLGLHHVREVPNPLPWDLGFLLLAALLPLGVGWLLTRQAVRERVGT
jgi:uncharacterized membrane protein